MRILIVDDEPVAAERLAHMLAELQWQDVHQAHNGFVALEKASDLAPDLIFLDIAMPEIDGFDVAIRLADPKPLIVFQTAYSEFALRAFDVQALDYLVKPISMDKLKRALQRAAEQRQIQNGTEPASPANLAALRATAKIRTPPLARALVRACRGHRLVPLDEIHYFYSSAGLVYCKTRERALLTDYTLKELEPRLPGFVRANRAQLVNHQAITALTQSDGKTVITLTDGAEIQVARRRCTHIRELLELG